METKSLFLQQIGQFVSTQSRLFTSLKSCYDKPTKIFEDNKGTIDMCAAERASPNHKHIDVPLQHLHELHEKGTFVCRPVSTHVQWADAMVKQSPAPKHLQLHGWYTGNRFLPPVSSEHYKLLTDSAQL